MNKFILFLSLTLYSMPFYTSHISLNLESEELKTALRILNIQESVLENHSIDDLLKEVDSTFRQLALQYHPDKNLHRSPWATAQFILVSNAHDTAVEELRNAKTKAEQELREAEELKRAQELRQSNISHEYHSGEMGDSNSANTPISVINSQANYNSQYYERNPENKVYYHCNCANCYTRNCVLKKCDQGCVLSVATLVFTIISPIFISANCCNCPRDDCWKFQKNYNQCCSDCDKFWCDCNCK